MKIVVTGGAGFIGSHLIDELLKKGHSIINIDNFDAYYLRKIKESNIKGHFKYGNKYQLIESDIRDKNISSFFSEDVEIIIHLAAKAGVRPSLENPIEYQDVNVSGTQNLLEIARQKKIRKFIFASSSSVYGKNKNVPWSESDHVLEPISPYASTKVSGELMGHVYSHLFGIQFLALRFFTVYGPRQRPDLAINKFFSLIKNGEEITLFGDGTTRRDYTYVADIVDGIVSAIEYKDSQFEIINLGNNKTIKLNELVNEIEKTIQITAKKIFAEEQPGDVKQTWADILKAEKLLDYNPKYSLEKGLEKFWEWHLQNQKK